MPLETLRQRQKQFGYCLLSVFAIAGLFLTISVLSVPIPGVNEPHYVCKARSFSDPAWCDRDFFLASADAHYCFFWLIGPLTQYLSFATVALIGRGISALTLAVGWTVLGRAVGLTMPSRVMAAGAFAFLSQLGSFSGEWLLGGFESKVASWGLGLCAAGFWIRATMKDCPGWMTVAGICCGASAILHPVVGGWIAVCICMAWLADLIEQRRTGRLPSLMKSISAIASFSFATIGVALPGLVPALRMVLDDSLDKKDRELASFIQVFWRLKHHLDPTELMPLQWLYAVGLLTVSLIAAALLRQRWKRDPHASDAANINAESSVPAAELTLLLKFFTASIFIALTGVLIGWHFNAAQDMDGWQWRAALLKFYPFRTFDALLPIVAGMLIASLLQWQVILPTRRWPKRDAILLMFCGLPFVPATLCREPIPPGYTADQYTDWLAVCEWIRTETPKEALFLTPRESCVFKWMAERAEYVCYKDCPQDATGILEWNRRLWWLHDWTLNSSMDGVYGPSDLAQLRAETGCNFIVTRILGPFETPAVWQGQHWQVVQIP